MATRVVLAGGLGNQLFQLAAGLAVSHGQEVSLNYTLANPRLTKDGLPDISNFVLPEGVKLEENNKEGTLIKKIVGFCIRESAINRSGSWVSILSFIATFAISILSRSFQWVKINAGIGLDENVKKFPRNSLLIGYYQTFEWANKPEVQFRLEEILNQTRSKFLRDTETVRPSLAVHIRLGDYKLENSFGIPSEKYFRKGIEYFKTREPNINLRIFSDEPRDIYSRISFLPQEKVEIYNDNLQSPVEVLLAMSESDFLVISNSTFSWWSAYFAGFRNASVVAPEPWFQRGTSPIRLIPPNWKSLSANYSERLVIND